MSILIYGTKFRCDLCETVARGPETDLSAINYMTMPVPEGWTNLALMEVTVKDVFSAPVTHLCPACSALDIGQLAGRMNARADQAMKGTVS